MPWTAPAGICYILSQEGNPRNNSQQAVVQCAESKKLQCLSLEVSQDFSIIFHLEQCSVAVLVAQLYPTLCDPTNCSLPRSCVHGILQARILEWIAIPFSRAFSWPRDRTQVSCIVGRFFTIWATGKIHLERYSQMGKLGLELYTIWDPTLCWCEERPRFQSESNLSFGTRYSLRAGFPGGSEGKEEDGQNNKAGLVNTWHKHGTVQILNSALSQVPEISGWSNDILAFNSVICDRMMALICKTIKT